MYGYIYETINLINGKRYIGMHKYGKQEIDESYLGSGIILKKAIEKYGRENFICRVIEYCNTREELSEREKYYISITKAPINDEYYNINDGGFGGHSEYYHQEMSENQLNALEKGRHLPASDKLKTQLSQYASNSVFSDETLKTLKEKQKRHRTINNGVENKVVDISEVSYYLNNGWSSGRVKKDYSERTKKFKDTHYSKDNSKWKNNLSNAFKGRRWVNNGINQHQVKQEELQSYLNNGYVLGRFKSTKRFND